MNPVEERTSEGWRARLKPHGAGRFFAAAFLALWLCGWLAGEVFAIVALIRGAASLPAFPPPGAKLGVGAFLLVWLAFWTFGGLMAARELLRLVWSEDSLIAGAGTLLVRRRMGPFTSTREWARPDIRSVYALPRVHALMVEMEGAPVTLSRLGTVAEQAEVAAALRAELGLPERPEAGAAGAGAADSASAIASATIPDGWQEVAAPDGFPVLVQNPHTRRLQARVVTALAMLAGAGALLLAGKTRENLDVLPVTIMTCAAAAGLTWGALWLGRGRMEWRLGSGCLTLRRRYGEGVRDVFEARALELSEHADSDGDEWYTLAALAREPAESAPAAFPSSPRGYRPRFSRKERRDIVRVMRDPTVPRHLGAWIARRTGIPFRDLSGPAGEAARAAAIAQIRALLPQNTLGKLAGRLLDRVGAGQPAKGTEGEPQGAGRSRNR